MQRTFKKHAKLQLNSKYITGMQSRIKYSIYITEPTYISQTCMKLSKITLMRKSTRTVSLVYSYNMIIKLCSIAIILREPPSPDWVNPYHAGRGLLSIQVSDYWA